MTTLIFKSETTQFEEKLIKTDSSPIYRYHFQNNYQGSYILESETRLGFHFSGWIMGQKTEFFIRKSQVDIIKE